MAAKRGSAKAKPEYVTEVSVPSGAQEEVYSKPYRGRPVSANMDVTSSIFIAAWSDIPAVIPISNAPSMQYVTPEEMLGESSNRSLEMKSYLA